MSVTTGGSEIQSREAERLKALLPLVTSWAKQTIACFKMDNLLNF